MVAHETSSLIKDTILTEEQEAISVKGFAHPVGSTGSSASMKSWIPLRQRVRAHARGHQLGEPVDRHARAAKHRIPAHDLAFQPILGSALGSSGLARPGRRRCARFEKQSKKIKRCERSWGETVSAREVTQAVIGESA
jgi:hypothetical protein